MARRSGPRRTNRRVKRNTMKRRNTNRKVKRNTLKRKVKRNTNRKVKRNTNRKVRRNTRRNFRRMRGGVSHHILFTDPAILGVLEYYTSTGDVDDTACIIYMSQKLLNNLTVVICDDAVGQRIYHFMEYLGKALMDKYNINLMSESTFSSSNVSGETTIHIHAPITDKTAGILSEQSSNIQQIYTQGDDDSVNFKKAEGAKLFLSESEHGVRYSTADTNFTIPNDPSFESTLSGLSKKVYSDYFLFQKRKSFGTAVHLSFLCNRLYSDTGFNKGPGNGIKMDKPLINELKGEGKLPDLSGVLLDAFNTTVSHGGCDETAMQNGKDLISLMNLYCHYDRLIVDGKLPNMGNLGEITKRDGVDERVAAKFDNVPRSTPLFDFAAAMFALEGISAEAAGEVDKGVLVSAVMESLTSMEM